MPAYGFLAIGVALLAIGGESALRGACGMARWVGMSPLFIGLLIVSAMSAAPELLVALQAAAHGSGDLAFGTIAGSNIVNALFAAGAAAMMRPLPGSPKLVLRDGGFMILASAIAVLAAMEGRAGEVVGLALIGMLAVYLLVCFFTDWRRPTPLSISATRGSLFARDRLPNLSTTALLFAFGLVCLYFGAFYAVHGAIDIARDFRVSQGVVGLTVLAIGASLPQIAVTVIAAARRDVDMAVGNLIGANVFGLLAVLGIVALVHPLAISPSLVQDGWVMLASAVVLVLFLTIGWRVTRLQGLVLVICYAVYLGFLAWRQGLLPLAGLGF